MTDPHSPARPPTATPTTLGALVSGYLDSQLDALARGDEALAAGELAAVHPTRVAARRARSTLRTFAPLFEPRPRREFAKRLRAWAARLGEIRDREVQIAWLDELRHDLSDDPAAVAAIDAMSTAYAADARRHLDDVRRRLAGPRRLATLCAAWRQPPYTPRAEDAAADVGGYLDRARDELAAALRAAHDHPNDADRVHAARKAGKRHRYAVELAAPVLGPAADQALAEARELQDQLGRHQDSIVAAALADRLLASWPVADARRAGVDRVLAAIADQGATARAAALHNPPRRAG